jgi:hypothetical protein
MIHSLAIQTKSRGNRGKVRILEIGADVDEAGRFHLQFDEAERSVVEHDNSHRKFQLAERDELAKHHCEPAVTRKRHDLATRQRGLDPNGLGHRVSHAPVTERADKPALTIHAEIAARRG